MIRGKYFFGTLKLSLSKTMNWVFVNFYTQTGNEIMAVSDRKSYKKKQDWLMLFLKSVSICTYVPTGIRLVSYLLSKKTSYA